MCGITGIICKKNYSSADLKTKIIAMNNVLKNRGPDGEGYFEDARIGVYLGHRRLSIIDLSEKANQPLFNEDKSLVLVFNGEIYNYLELRDELISKGHLFSSLTDSEVLLHGWEEWGACLFNKINGMYAFCIYDLRKKEMILARDNVGIKPLYYLESPYIFSFASESRAFYPLRGTLWKAEINNSILQQMLLFQYVIDRQKTIYAGINKIPAGHFLHYKEGNSVIRSYWDIKTNNGKDRISIRDAVDEADTQFNRAIKWQLRSDVPIGILLSGGLDSSLVAAVARKYANTVNTFTATFDHKLDERDYARKCAESIGSNHREFNIDPLSINNRIEEIIKFYDDLSTFDGAVFTVYLMAEKIKQFGIKVVLVGEGADEIFGGYSWFGLSRFPFNLMPSLFRTFIYHYAVSRQFSGRKNMQHLKYMDDIIRSFREDDIFRQISRFEVFHQLPNHLLMKVDRGTMAHSIEARVPFLDKCLVEFAYGLNSSFKLKGKVYNFFKSNEKFILREMAKKYLPEAIFSRKKRGFSIPMELVLKSNKAKVYDYVTSSNSFAMQSFSLKQIRQLFEFKNVLYSPIHKQKEFILWRLFLLEVWRNNVYKQ